MRRVPLGSVQYIGADIVQELVEGNRQFETERIKFVRLDLLTDALPKADLILCRDCLIHLSYDDISRALGNIRQSGARYLLTSTYPARKYNHDIATGGCRAVNLEIKPFKLPPPLRLINEEYSEGGVAVPDKSLGLWEVGKI
jgi:hypothetical protein